MFNLLNLSFKFTQQQINLNRTLFLVSLTSSYFQSYSNSATAFPKLSPPIFLSCGLCVVILSLNLTGPKELLPIYTFVWLAFSNVLSATKGWWTVSEMFTVSSCMSNIQGWVEVR